MHETLVTAACRVRRKRERRLIDQDMKLRARLLLRMKREQQRAEQKMTMDGTLFLQRRNADGGGRSSATRFIITTESTKFVHVIPTTVRVTLQTHQSTPIISHTLLPSVFLPDAPSTSLDATSPTLSEGTVRSRSGPRASFCIRLARAHATPS